MLVTVLISSVPYKQCFIALVSMTWRVLSFSSFVPFLVIEMTVVRIVGSDGTITLIVTHSFTVLVTNFFDLALDCISLLIQETIVAGNG